MKMRKINVFIQLINQFKITVVVVTHPVRHSCVKVGAAAPVVASGRMHHVAARKRSPYNPQVFDGRHPNRVVHSPAVCSIGPPSTVAPRACIVPEQRVALAVVLVRTAVLAEPSMDSKLYCTYE